jgi:hypothetical protein
MACCRPVEPAAFIWHWVYLLRKSSRSAHGLPLFVAEFAVSGSCWAGAELPRLASVLLGRFGIVLSDGCLFQRRTRFADDPFQAKRIRLLRDLLNFR